MSRSCFRTSRHVIEPLEARIAPALIFTLTTDGKLLSFDSSAPGKLLSTVAITGLMDPATEHLASLAFRPSTGELYAIGVNDFDSGPDKVALYTLNAKTGVAKSFSGALFGTNFAQGADYGMSFDPVADALRVVNTANQNLRVDPNTGGLVANDSPLGGGVAVYAAAYDRPYVGATATTLFGLDFATDSLVRIGSSDGVPNTAGTGNVSVIGSLGALTTNLSLGGLSIDGHGVAFAAINTGVNNLYTINLGTGAATSHGQIGDGLTQVRGLAVAPGDLHIAINGKSATFNDVDGDLVTVTLTKGTLDPAQFRLAQGPLGAQLLRFQPVQSPADLTTFADTAISITAKPQKGHGDGYVNVGAIDATGFDLGKVTIGGDLGQIDAGDDSMDGDLGLSSLTVHSMGALGTSTQLPNGDLYSTILGRLGTLTVKTDVIGARIEAAGNAGSIGNVSIGGDLVGGNNPNFGAGLFSFGTLGNVTLGGSVIGGSTTFDGDIFGDHGEGKITIGGSVIGGAGSSSAYISSNFSIGAVTIKGDLVGGSGAFSGFIFGTTEIASFTLGGSLLGGQVADSLTGTNSGSIGTNGDIPGGVKIGGDLVGGNGPLSGYVNVKGQLGPVTVGGSLQGTVSHSGSIFADAIASAHIGGDLRGGQSNADSGSISTDTGSIGPVRIGGSILLRAAINAAVNLGDVTIGGDLRAGVGELSTITATGVPNSAVAAIKSLTVKGSVVNAAITAGVFNGNPDAVVGAVTVSGDWVNSSLAAGSADDFVGNEDDIKAAEPVADALFSRIASIHIGGLVAGTPGGSDHSGFVAERIGSMTVGGVKVPLTAGLDKVGFALGTTGDVRVREIDDTAAVFPATGGPVGPGLKFVSNQVATYHDEDGDLVTVKTSKGTFDVSQFTFAANAAFGAQLQTFRVGIGAFSGADLSFTATPDHGHGDGFANVGFLDSTGLDLGKVSVDGDLGRIAAEFGAKGIAVGSLTVHSIGLFGASTQAAGGSLASTLDGRLGALTIKTDMVNASISTTGLKGTTGNLTIGGSVVGGDEKTGVFSAQAMGNVTIGRSLIGGSVLLSGKIDATGGTMGSVKIGDSLVGGAGSDSGVLQSLGAMGAVAIKGALLGGTAGSTGRVSSHGHIASVTLGGSLVGGTVANFVQNPSAGLIEAIGAAGSIGPVKIGGGIRGSNSAFSGSVTSDGPIASVTVAQSIIGGTNSVTGAIATGSRLGPVTIGGDLRASSGLYSGSILTSNAGDIDRVAIGGSVAGAIGGLHGILAQGNLGPVTLGGSLRAGPGESVRVSAQGKTDTSGGIVSLTVKGSVRAAFVLSGHDRDGLSLNPDATIGAVTVGGDWLASSLGAGVTNLGADHTPGGTDDNQNFGNDDDHKIAEMTVDTLSAKIASIAIKGFAIGTPGVAGDHFGFVAEQIGRLTVGAWKAPLTSGTDTAGLDLTSDLTVREV